MPMKPVQLPNLPVELVCHILECLDVLDLLACSVLNKHLRKLVLDSSSLQYTIELAMHRMVSVLPAFAAPPFATRLEILRDRENAWRSLAWGGRYELKLPATGSVYEFVGGFYGNGKEDEGRAAASISFFELPSPGNVSGTGSNLRMWTHLMGDVLIIDFTMDPSQDLLVLVAFAPSASKFVYEVHLRTLSTNEPHPKAPLGVLPCLSKPTDNTPYPMEVGAAVRVQVAGDLVALLIKEVLDSMGGYLEVWNWDSSPQFSCSMSGMVGIDDFCFLSHDAFLLVRPSGIFEVYTFQTPSTAPTMPVLCVSYTLPQLSRGYRYWYISMSCNPAAGYVPKENSGPEPRMLDSDRSPSLSKDERPAKQLYYPSPDERIHACCVYIFNMHGQEDTQIHSFVFFMNIGMFLKPNMWSSPLPSTIPIVRTASTLSRSSSSSADSSSSKSSSLVSVSESSPSTEESSINDPVSIVSAEGGYSRLSSQHQTFSSPYPLDLSFSTSPSPSPSPSPSFHHPLHIHPSTSLPSFPSAPFDSITSAPASRANPITMASPSPPLYSPATSTTVDINASSNTNSIPVHTPSTIPWELWGSHNTRWFEESLSTDWQHATYGLRTADSVPVPVDVGLDASAKEGERQAGEGMDIGGGGEGGSGEWNISEQGGLDSSDEIVDEEEDEEPRKRRLRIRDFNPFYIRHGLDFDDSDGKGGAEENGKRKDVTKWKTRRIVTEPSTTPVKGVFVQDIVSSLPYAEVVTEEVFDVSDVMLDDSRVLLLKRSWGGQLKGINVLSI